MDKQNKAVRQRRKREEMARLRSLVGIGTSDLHHWGRPLAPLPSVMTSLLRGSPWLPSTPPLCNDFVTEGVPLAPFPCVMTSLVRDSRRLFPDNAYACDPRVKQFKEEEKAEREARRRAREEAARQEAEGRIKASGVQ